jgi:hypothetical protein
MGHSPQGFLPHRLHRAFLSGYCFSGFPFTGLCFIPPFATGGGLGNRAFGVALPVWLIFAAGHYHWRAIEILSRCGLERNDALTWAVGGALFVAASWLDVQTRHAFGWRRLVGLTELNPEHQIVRGDSRTGFTGASAIRAICSTC